MSTKETKHAAEAKANSATVPSVSNKQNHQVGEEESTGGGTNPTIANANFDVATNETAMNPQDQHFASYPLQYKDQYQNLKDQQQQQLNLKEVGQQHFNYNNFNNKKTKSKANTNSFTNHQDHNKMPWLTNTSVDTNEFYWHEQQQQHQQQQHQQKFNHCNTSFIVPEDIPPPPPQPILKNGFKRFVYENNQQQHQEHEHEQGRGEQYQQQQHQQACFVNCSHALENSYELQPLQQQQYHEQQHPKQNFKKLQQHQFQIPHAVGPQQQQQHEQYQQQGCYQNQQQQQYAPDQHATSIKQQTQQAQQQTQSPSTQPQQQQIAINQQPNHLQQAFQLQQQQHQQRDYYHQHSLLRNQELPTAQQRQQQHHKHPYHHHYHHHHHHQTEQLQQHEQQQPMPTTRFKYHSNLFLKEQQQQSLVHSRQKIRLLRLTLISVFVLLLLSLLITAFVFALGAGDTPTSERAEKLNAIKLEDLLSGQLTPKEFEASWTGSKLLYRDNASIVEFDVTTKERIVLLNDEQYQYATFEKSADGNFLLLSKSYRRNFRHSFSALYDILDISSGKIYPLLHAGEQHFLWIVKWAPVGNALIFNYAANLYYKRNAQPDSEVITITNDANPHVLNGIPDWIYEEEVFSSNTAVWFNPSATQIAFISFDNSATSYMNLQVFGQAGDLRYQYPLYKSIPYPKAGASNPRVRLITADLLHLVEGSDSHLTEVPVPSALNTEADYIITNVEWLTNDLMLSVWMNRIQNRLYMQVYNGMRRYELFNLESKTGWIRTLQPPHKSRTGSIIAVILPQNQSNADGLYHHLCLLPTRSPNAQPEALTKGRFEVEAILHWDHENDVIFYTANTEMNSESLHVYAVKASAGQKSKCLTCNTSEDTKQSYFKADFNNGNLVAIQSMGPFVPKTDIYEWKWSNNQLMLNHMMSWENNTRLRDIVSKLAMPQTEIHDIPIGDGFTAKVSLQLPPNMDRSGRTKYPMLVDVYAGPDTSAVSNKFEMDWGVYLSSNQSIIYAKIDGRGSGLRGVKLAHAIYLKLGTLEIMDQIKVTKQLLSKFVYIDGKHIGIWGWSYGGYAAAMALAADDENVFNCAASVAPVTDWAYYDSIYTERYMSLPKLNELGYNASRLTTNAHKLRGKKYLLIHGTLDDNVHYQQALVLAKSLERQNILFKQISYTDEDHSLANVRPHLYHSLDRFFGDCFASKSMMRSRK